MSDEPRTSEGPEPARPAGAVTTSERPGGERPGAERREGEPAPPAPASSEGHDEIRIVDEPAADDRDDATITLDETPTVELAVDDLREAAAAAGVDLETLPGVQPATPPDAAPGERPDAPAPPADGELLGRLDPMDPRIRERRIAVTRAEGRRRLRILLAIVTFASLVGIAWLVVQSPLLAVNEIKVSGVFHETPDGVRAASGVSEGDALVWVDEAAVRRRIEALPWVAEAEVSRELPNGLRIAVVERLPTAWLRRPSPPGAPRDSGAIALVDKTGRILGDQPGVPAGLPELAGGVRIGAAGSVVRPAGLARAVAELPDALRAQVAAISRDDGRYVLTLVAPPGGPEPAAEEIRLGALEEIPAKGAAALAVLDQLTREESQTSYIDVRVPSAPATG